ncbi:Uncharacterised protein [uncultured Flavonifractor sp.]|nr:Uncharacterised protein [uncultured Flavonifractor sp.]
MRTASAPLIAWITSMPFMERISVAISMFSSLSSARRIFRPASWKAALFFGSRRSSALSSPETASSGRVTVNLLPFPSVLSTEISPLICCTRLLTMGMPSPVPTVDALVKLVSRA